jgi:hypothetical protein
MTHFRMNTGITPGPDRSLNGVYERMLGRTIPADAACTTDQTPGTTP